MIRLSLPAPMLRAVVRSSFRPLLGRRVPVRAQRVICEAMLRPLTVTRGARIRAIDLGGVPTEVVEHDGADRTAAILYLHGGGYTALSPRTHRALAAHLALATGCPVYCVDYRLAPEHPHPAALDDTLAAYHALLATGLRPDRVAIAGDSAGGGLTLAAALRLREIRGPLPAALGLISPWLDLTLSGESVTELAATDPLLTPSWLRACAQAYAGGRSPDDLELSPLLADLRGLPPVMVQGGADDVLVSDADRFVERARAAGVQVEHDRVEGLWHDFQVLAGILGEAETALARLGVFLRTRIEGTPRTPSVAIIGGGFAGVGLGIRLRQHGFDDFTIFEKADRVGGVWRENTYPGAACDIPSHLYSYSFERKRDWSRRFSPQSDILGYLEDCVHRYGLDRHLRLGTEIASADFDEGSRRWRLRTAAGETVEVDVLVTACGQLSRPAMPAIPGIESFAGTSFHSARWDHSYDLTGKRVAVIGTGASAIQFVPEIAKRVERLHLFQRSAPWVIPKFDGRYGGGHRSLFRWLPLWPLAARLGWFLYMEFATVGFTRKRWLVGPIRLGARTMLRTQVRDPELRARLTPDYEMGCKRVLISSDYYPALARENVEMITEAVRQVTAHGVVTADGVERRVDAIVYGTGFTANAFLAPIHIRGLGGRSLDDAWSDGAEAYLGLSVSGFPNLFIMYGPNTNLGAGSIIHMLESQMTWIVGGVTEMTRSPGAALDVRDGAQTAFDREVQERLRTSVWQSGCTSWYRTPSGRVVNNWPGLMSEYRRRTRRFDTAAYRVLAPVAAAGGDRELTGVEA
ncbi:MAG TPA: alpha/beta hydrolase fold domain-containing protein [Candidatus Dormibacteraeota bacterium]|nr:alpha/beta hydrolase fold domain-containing protein [Candidatus Dormibacteraeota bacterium]